MRKIIFFICFLLATGLVFSEEPIRLTLNEAIEIALRDNREILLKKEDLKKAKEKLREAKAGLFPRLNLGISLSEILDYYSENATTLSKQISIKQPLYTGGKISGNIEKGKYGIEIGKLVLDRTILEIVYNVKKSFFTLLLAKEYFRITNLMLDNTKKHLEVTIKRYRNGQVPESELMRIKEALATVEHIYNLSLNQMEEIKTVFKNILYLEGNVEIELEGEFIYEPIEVAFDEVYLKALRDRPELRIYEVQERINKLDKEIAKAELLPNIYTSWDYYVNYSRNLPLTVSEEWKNHQTVGVVVSWPIFDGFATQAKIRQAEIDLKETQLLKEKTISDITLELKNAYLELKNAISKLKAKDAEINFYEDNLRIMNDKYKAGIVSDLDLESAQLSFEIAQFNRKEAIYDYLVAKAKLEKAIGGIR